MSERDIREMRGVRGLDDNGKPAWLRLYELENGVQVYLTQSSVDFTPEVARRLAAQLLDLADRVERSTS